MKKLQIGIVGAGRIGNVHAQSITYHIPQAEIAMITDVRIESAKALAEYASTLDKAVKQGVIKRNTADRRKSRAAKRLAAAAAK